MFEIDLWWLVHDMQFSPDPMQGGGGRAQRGRQLDGDDSHDENHGEAGKKPKPTKDFRVGYGCAVLNVFFDAYASVLTKQHGGGFTTWEINLLR